MRRLSFLLMLPVLISLAACATGSSNGPTPTTPPFTSEVTVTRPQPGTVIYAEVLHVAGMVNGDDTQTLVIDLSKTGESLAQMTLDAAPGDWSLELPHDYAGQPVAVELIVRPAGTGTAGEYVRIPLTIADISHRPAGAFATIFVPQPGDTLGGDTILVEGTASGIDALSAALLDANGAVLDEQDVTVDIPFLIDEVPWQVELAPGTYTGAARIELRFDETIEVDPIGVDITLDLAAG